MVCANNELIKKYGTDPIGTKELATIVGLDGDRVATKKDIARLEKRMDRKTNFILALVGVILALVGTGFTVLGILATAILTAVG